MDEGFVPSENVELPVVPAAQVEVTVTALEIWFVMPGFPTACT